METKSLTLAVLGAGSAAVKDAALLAGSAAVLCCGTDALPKGAEAASLDDACQRADYILINSPVPYDAAEKKADTSRLDADIRAVLAVGTKAMLVVRSVVPVGYTKGLREKLGLSNVIVCPFAGNRDCIVVGAPAYDSDMTAAARRFGEVLADAQGGSVPVQVVGYGEAEAARLYIQTYLAMRTAFFNELDTFADKKGLNARQIINAVCADGRIGQGYNDPGFGYTCLSPQKLMADYEGLPQQLISAVVKANRTRKNFSAERILEKGGYYLSDAGGCGYVAGNAVTAGLYKVTNLLESGSTSREVLLQVMERMAAKGAEVIVYDPALENGSRWESAEVVNDLSLFKARSDVILSARYCEDLNDSIGKVYIRDLHALED